MNFDEKLNKLERTVNCLDLGKQSPDTSESDDIEAMNKDLN